MAFCTAAARSSSATDWVLKPEGGFRFITVVQLVMAYWAYREGFIRFQDLRVYLGAHEGHERRCHAKLGQRTPTYKLQELRRLTGARHILSVRESLKRLERVGLMRWGSGGVHFASALDELAIRDRTSLEAMLASITNNRRAVPVPRRTLKLLAGGARRAVVATVFGHLLRCAYYRDGGCRLEGACKASWVASVFGIAVRKVKEARAHLRAIGWLTVDDSTAQWYRNRYGARCRINATWRQGCSRFSTGESAPLPAISTGESAPPDSDQNPLREEFKNQEPARAADRRELVSSKSTRRETSLGKPMLRNVLIEDLRDTARLLELFAEATELGLVNGGEAARLNVVAAAEHALAIGSINPPGLFARLIRKAEWHHITEADDEAARRRLKRHDFGYCEAEREIELERVEEKPREMAALFRSGNAGGCLGGRGAN